MQVAHFKPNTEVTGVDRRPSGRNESEFDQLEEILSKAREAGIGCEAELVNLAQRRLRRIARRLLGEKADSLTLGPTALVNEGFLRMFSEDAFGGVIDAKHFYARFALCMKHAMIDYARAKATAKRGGSKVVLSGNSACRGWTAPQITSVEVDDALRELSSLSERAARAVLSFELQYFGGLTIAEIAAATNQTQSTVNADLRCVKAYLRSVYEPI